MLKTVVSEVANNLSALRQKRGLSAAALAKESGVTRQTIYAIEAGSFVPNTAVALRLARALDSAVEDLFMLPEDSASAAFAGQAALLPGSSPVEPGQPVQLCRVGQRLMATPPSAVPWSLPAGDAAVTARPSGARMKVQLYREDADLGNRLLVAGCDPGISVLARHLQAAGVDLVLAHRNSSQALQLLKQGMVHIAGTHLRDEASGEFNIPAIARLFARNAVAVVSFAVWEEGIVTARGNPKGIRGIEDLARKDVRLVNRGRGQAAGYCSIRV